MQNPFSAEQLPRQEAHCGNAHVLLSGTCKDRNCGKWTNQLVMGRWCAPCATKHQLEPLIIQPEAAEPSK